MEIMDKGLTVPKWGLIVVRSKIPQIPQNLFGRSSQLAQKFGISLRKKLHWASVVCATRSLHQDYNNICSLEQNVYCTATALEIIGPTEVARP